MDAKRDMLSVYGASAGQLKNSRSLSFIGGVNSEIDTSTRYPIEAGNNCNKLASNLWASRQGVGGALRHLQTQQSMPARLNQKRRHRDQEQDQYQIHHSILDEQIINCQLSIAPKKDFGEEVRALTDVRKFVSNSFILTDISEVRIGKIVKQIVERLVECRQLAHEVAEEAKSVLFVEKSSLDMLLSNTMQGIYKSRADGRLAYDNSWVVAVCSLATLHKRQVAIARFASPVNFGRHSQEVRFLIIVLAPNKEKLTKSAWETGRTFATIFTDVNFRRRLLRTKDQDEFKMELLAKAEHLARENEPPVEPHGATVFDMSQLQSGKVNYNSGQLTAAGQRMASNKHKYNGKISGSINNSKSNGRNNNNSSLISCANEFDDESGAARRRLATSGCNACWTSLGAGLASDLKRRAGFYWSDFTDGFRGERSLYKTVATTVFLYFALLLPCITFGVVDTHNTEGYIDPRKTMLGQALGGAMFALFSGQPLVVIMTTAPLCIYVKVIYQIAKDLEVEFASFYALVGVWLSFYLILMSLTNLSSLMRFCTRSTEDIFALFTAFAFGFDGLKEAKRSFDKYYWEAECHAHRTVLVSRTLADSPALAIPSGTPPSAANTSRAGLAGRSGGGGGSLVGSPIKQLTGYTMSPLGQGQSQAQVQARVRAQVEQGQLPVELQDEHLTHKLPANIGAHHEQQDLLGLQSRCQRELCILFLLLMCGTVWLANSFSSFDKTPYLSSRKREVIKDYALAISVLVFSFIGSFLFADIQLDSFDFGQITALQMVGELGALPVSAQAAAGLLGLMLSVLFYIDQNICGAMVNNAPYKLRKGNYFHLDLMVLAILNGFLSLFGLPWMHGKLPHSHLHSKALADYEERVDDGHVHQTIVNIRETRLTSLFVSLLVAASLWAVPYPLAYIPLPVLSGVFLYTALAEFKSNSMVERICLLFTEQAAYPPNHYIRRCPQRKIHLFTLAQLLQLLVVTMVGFYPNPYVNMTFPLVVATFIPIRDQLLPKLIDLKFLNSLDGKSLE